MLPIDLLRDIFDVVYPIYNVIPWMYDNILQLLELKHGLRCYEFSERPACVA